MKELSPEQIQELQAGYDFLLNQSQIQKNFIDAVCEINKFIEDLIKSRWETIGTSEISSFVLSAIKDNLLLGAWERSPEDQQKEGNKKLLKLLKVLQIPEKNAIEIAEYFKAKCEMIDALYKEINNNKDMPVPIYHSIFLLISSYK